MEQAVSIWRWTAGNPPQAWGKLARDPELWDPEGDTLVFFGQRYKEAAFRIHSSALLKTGSDFFLHLLHDGRRVQDDDSISSELNALPPRATVFPYDPSRDALSDVSSSASSQRGADVHPGVKVIRSKKSFASPPISSSSHDADMDPTVRYSICFPAPPKLAKAAAIQYHLTTRNVLALLLHRSPVGIDFGIALKDLQRRLEAYMPPKTNCARLVVRYVASKQLHDVSNNPATALGLLTYSEGPSVRWREGYREAFVHSCGMFPRLHEVPEFDRLSAVSRQLLESAHAQLQARIRDAEHRLLRFDFEDLWPAPARGARHPPARAGFDSFRRFLRGHYEKAYKFWRVRVAQEHCNDSWLTRQLVRELQEDHGALYDFLVDRDMVWGAEGQVRRKKGTGPPRVEQIDDEPVARLLSNFDGQHRYMPVLHPYPLLPASIPVETDDDDPDDDLDNPAPDDRPRHRHKPSRRSLGVFGNRAQRAREKRVAQAYADANNTALLAPAATRNALVEAFRKYEKGDALRSMDPRDARKGRWMLLYAVLQVLAGISVDTPHLFFTDVPYFLNPRLTNTPPWAVTGRQPAGGGRTVVGVYDEASRLYSHCWVAPKTWGAGASASTTTTVPPGQFDRQLVITTSDIDGYSLVSDRTSSSAHTGKSPMHPPSAHHPHPDSAPAEFEVRADAFLFDDGAGPYDGPDLTLDEDADLENRGLPGFRAPLPQRPRAPSEPPTPSSATAAAPAAPRVAASAGRPRRATGGEDVGRSDYTAPDEW